VNAFPNASQSTRRRNPHLFPAFGVPNPEQRQRPEALAGCDGGEAPRPGLRHCRFTLVRKQLLDVDAKYASVKDLLDCLATAGVIRGDKEGEVTLEVRQRRVEKGEKEHTLIDIYET
jgi:hypothetical protein